MGRGACAGDAAAREAISCRGVAGGWTHESWQITMVGKGS